MRAGEEAGAETEAETEAARDGKMPTEARGGEPETEHIAAELSELDEVPGESPGAGGDISSLEVARTSWGEWKSKRVTGRP